MNLWLRRRWRFDPRLLPAVIDQVRSVNPQLVLLSGDLTTTALEAEFGDAAAGLRPLLEGCPAVLTPGNHDRYTAAATRDHLLERYLPGTVPEHFPMLRPLTERWQLLMLDTAVPRALSARGRAGPEQLAETKRLIGGLAPGVNLVVLSHYPVALPPGIHDHAGHALDDADQLRKVLSGFPGRMLYLHGHVHQPWCWQPTNDGLERVLMVNAGAPCRKSAHYPRGQGFWQIDLDDAADQPVLIHHQPEPAAAADVPASGGPGGLGPAFGWQTRLFP
jgi:3',5'-cyclic AMP phosphodiesterase CpdA